jgi:hypothetical protein
MAHLLVHDLARRILNGPATERRQIQKGNDMKTAKSGCAVVLIAVCLAAPGAPDDAKVHTTFQNPVGDLVSVPFQNNTNFPIASSVAFRMS